MKSFCQSSIKNSLFLEKSGIEHLKIENQLLKQKIEIIKIMYQLDKISFLTTLL